MSNESENLALRLHATDNVAVLKKPLKRGSVIAMGAIHVTAARDVPAGHKIALDSINEGDAIRKYGQVIGFASRPIDPGDHVHTHNVAAKDFGRDYEFCTDVHPVASEAGQERGITWP